MQGFARLSAVYGGTYMLNKTDVEVVYDEAGQAIGVQSEGVVAKAKLVVGDPSYFKAKTQLVGKVVRCVCIMVRHSVCMCVCVCVGEGSGLAYTVDVCMCVQV
jgi:RAB protein geranylgeranyltransferase component A